MSQFHIYRLLSTLLGIWVLFAYGQSPYLINYSSSDGLPSNECYDLIQDPDGFIWIAGDRGVARFDGTNFRSFSVKDGLIDNLVTGLYLDTKGNVWCNSYRNGIMMIGGEHVHVPEWMDDLEFTGYRLDDFVEMENGTLCLSLQNVRKANDIYLMATVTNGKEIAYETWQSDSGSVIGLASNSTSKAYHFFSAKGAAPLLVRIGDEQYSTKPIVFPERISDVIHNGTDLFVAAKQTLFRINRDTIDSVQLDGLILNSLFVDEQSGLWVGTSEHGAYYYPNGDISVPPQRFLENRSVTSVIQDQQGGIWFSTIENGIYFMPYRSVGIWNDQNGLPSQRITHATICDSTLWIGFRNGALASLSTHHAQPEIKVEADYKYIFDLDCNDGGGVLVSVHGPDHQANELVREIEASSVFIELSNGDILTSPPAGAVKRTRGADILWSSESDRVVPRMFAMCPHPTDGSVWMGGTGGLFRYQNDTITPLSHLHPLLQNRVSTITFYRDWTLIGMHGFGLLMMSEQDTFHLHSDHGLHSDFVYALRIVNDTAWVATSNGIDYMHLDSGNRALHLHHIGTDMGLPSATVANVEIINGSLWAMTDEGIAVIPVGDIAEKSEPANLYLRSIAVNGMPRDDHHDHHNLQLSATENNISIAVQAIAFRNAQAQRYYYRFTGDQNVPWTRLNGNRLDLANLSPGNYHLEIKTAPGDVSGRALLPLYFEIMPPFWMRWYSLLAMALVLTALTVVLFRNRVRQIRKAALIDRRLNALNYRALKARMNPHFIYNALNAIQHFIMQEESSKSVKYLGGFSKLIRHNFENSSKDFVPLEDELKSLQLYIELEDIRYPGRFEYRLKTEGLVDRIQIPPMIIQPFIENAILHGILPQREPGLITLMLTTHKRFVSVRIEDNGIGIHAGQAIRKKKQQMLRSMTDNTRESAMKVTKERIAQLARQHMIDAGYEVLDKQDSDRGKHGTIVCFNLPLHNRV